MTDVMPDTAEQAKAEYAQLALWFANVNRMVQQEAPLLKSRADTLRGFMLGMGVAQSEIDAIEVAGQGPQVVGPPTEEQPNRAARRAKKPAPTKRTAPTKPTTRKR